jgi:glycosyltransferase involved in cell wall biosynthesis
MQIAIVHEWLVTRAGSEQVVEQILSLYPQAELFSLVEFLSEDLKAFIRHKPVHTSFLQNLPFAKRHFRQYLPLMPLAIEQFDLSTYDIVISSHHAVAKGVLTRADQLHISYVHTPIRYAWDLSQQYLQGAKLNRGLKAIAAQLILHYLRLWDVACANRVDYFVANSRYVARRIAKTYRRPAQVIYPPVAVDRFQPRAQREEFYLAIARFVPYKRVDLIVQAFAKLGLPLIVIGDGSERPKIESYVTPNITLLEPQSDGAIASYLERCKAFVFAAEEDFGITPVEAQAAGAPVIAYGKGGVTETVIPGKTGLLFPAQTVESLMEAVQQFEDISRHFQVDVLRQNAERFSPERFQTEFFQLIDRKWTQFCQGDDIEY